VSNARVCNPRWTVVVVSWNGREDTLECLGSLNRNTGEDVAVVCVDNGSQDGTAEAVRRDHPEVALVENGRNLGFAGGSNVGIRHGLEAGSQWILLLNNDATIAPEAVVAFGRAAGDHPHAGVLAGKILFRGPGDRVWFAGARSWPGLGYSGRPRGWGKRDGQRYGRVEPTGRAAGAFMAMSRAALEAIGPLDEDLFAYVEDVEWCARARRAGFEVLFVPDAVAWHRVSASTGGELTSTHNVYYGCRNSVLVAERHRPLPRPLKWARRSFILAIFAAHALRRENRREALAAVLEGYRDALRGRSGERPEHASARS
jgi:GT2 family glycosyltransferase